MTDIPINKMYSSINANEYEWNLTEIPIPKDMLVYAVDSKNFKLGNGSDLYRDLPIFFNAGDMDRLRKIYELFPELTNDDDGRILIVDSDNQGYVLSNISISDIVTVSIMNTALDTKADKTHYHNSSDITNLKSAALRDVGVNPGEVPEILSNGKLNQNIVPTVTGDTLDNDKIISYLVLTQLVADQAEKLNLPNGFADEYEDQTGIDLDNMVNANYSSGAYSGTNMVLPSITVTSELSPDVIRVFLRASVDDPVNDNMTLKVSRDGGDNHVSVQLEESKMSSGSVCIFVGEGDLTMLPAGTDIKYEITNGEQSVTIHGLCLRWG